MIKKTELLTIMVIIPFLSGLNVQIFIFDAFPGSMDWEAASINTIKTAIKEYALLSLFLRFIISFAVGMIITSLFKKAWQCRLMTFLFLSVCIILWLTKGYIYSLVYACGYFLGSVIIFSVKFKQKPPPPGVMSYSRHRGYYDKKDDRESYGVEHWEEEEEEEEEWDNEW